MNSRIFFAILCGAMIGGAFVYALAEQTGWYLLGVPMGGAIAWLTYAWPDITREVPRVWASVSLWQLPRPDIRYWRAVGIYVLSVMLTSTAVTSNLLLVSLLIWGVQVVENSAFQFCTVILFLIGMVYCGDDEVIGEFRKRRVRRLHYKTFLRIAKRNRKLIITFSPIGVVIMLFKLVVYLPRALRVVALFLTQLFVHVHSNDALDCFLYAATGVLIGSLLTQSIWVMIVSATIGIALAFIGRSLARWLKVQWPTLAT